MHEVKPQVFLLDYGTTIDEMTHKLYLAYRRCYATNLRENEAGKKEMENFIRKMLKAEHAHESPLEHASLTFHITCSRACSHQLVRHRIASYSQQSQRYVKMDNLPVVVPPNMGASGARLMERVCGELEGHYKNMIAHDIPAEDARYLLPNAVATHIVVTMNLRSLRHFFAERCCNRAQWEIRDIANQMLAVCKEVCPVVFENVGPHCMKLKRCPEAKPCGKRPWVEYPVTI